LIYFPNYLFVFERVGLHMCVAATFMYRPEPIQRESWTDDPRHNINRDSPFD